MNYNLNKYIENLNYEQKLAVETIQGPVLVVAGPGTGKTQVLALRIANILVKTDTNPSNILCLTFTESGVAAMRQRLLKIIGNDAYYVRIHTFHSFCNDIIQSFPEKFAFARELSQLDDLNKIKIIKNILEEFSKNSFNDKPLENFRDKIYEINSLKYEKNHILTPFHNIYFYQFEIISAIQNLKREGVSSEILKKLTSLKLEELSQNKNLNLNKGKPKVDWLSSYKSQEKNLELSHLFKSYNNELLNNGYYDYEDMILFVIKKFKEDEELLSYYQEKYLYLLVDEYQDTNGAQNELLKLLAFDASPNIFAVGDDDQAIYRFQGANIENLLFFENQFENVKTIPIVKNYRSSQNILDASQSLIKHNKSRLVNIMPDLNKNIKAALNITNHKVEIYELSTMEKEDNFIVQKINELHSKGINYSDIAILYRKHSDSLDIIEALNNVNIPIKLAAGKNTLDQQIIIKILNLFRIIQYNDKNRDFLLFQVLFYDFFEFERLDVFKLTTFAYDNKLSLFDLLINKEKLIEANLTQPDKLNKFANQIVEWKSYSANYSLIQFVQKVATESNYITYIFKTPTNIDYINSINSFYSYIKELNKQNKNITLEEFLKDIDLLIENNLVLEERIFNLKEDAINLMTAHKSKGLEFKYIFIIKFYEGNWGGKVKREIIKLPSEIFDLNKRENLNNLDNVNDNAVEDKPTNEIEDERRLLYVALTRAKEYIFISFAKEYPSGNSKKIVAPSQFLYEFDSKYIEYKNSDLYEQVDNQNYKNDLTAKLIIPYNLFEKDFLKLIIKDFKLSATSLNEYIKCPLKFKFNTLLKVPKLLDTSVSMGIAIHYVLENYYRHLKSNEIKNRSYILYLYEKSLEKQLLGSNDFNLLLTEGKKILNEYFDFYEKSLIIPAEIEYTFNSNNLILELPDSDPIQLKGKIDKIEWINKDNNSVRIVDYKTSIPKSSNVIKGLTKNSDGSIFRQLSFYYLLAESDDSFRPKLNSSKYRIEEVEVDFLRPNVRGVYKKEKFNITQNNIVELKEKITDVVKRIRNLEFNGSAEYPLCNECNFCKMMINK